VIVIAPGGFAGHAEFGQGFEGRAVTVELKDGGLSFNFEAPN
jgi:hypothetical protein